MIREIDLGIRTQDAVTVTTPEPMRKQGEDITQASIGRRTNSLISEVTEGSQLISEFRSEGSVSDRAVILLPGIVPSSDITFLKQKQELIRNGYQVISLDYSPNGFNKELLRAQLEDLLASSQLQDRDVTIIAVSFGATCALDFLAESSSKSKENVTKAVFIGAINSFEDIDDPLFNKAMRISNMAPELLKRSFMPFLKRAFRTDPVYTEELGEEAIRADLSQMTSRALVERMKAIAQAKSGQDLPKIDGVEALFIGWEKDYSSPKSLRDEMDLFKTAESVTIAGRHGYTATNAPEINKLMIDFMSSPTNVAQAA